MWESGETRQSRRPEQTLAARLEGGRPAVFSRAGIRFQTLLTVGDLGVDSDLFLEPTPAMGRYREENTRALPYRSVLSMETSLHRQLKQLYADRGARVEAPLDNYRIDVICGGELIEIQHGSLAAIRRKVQDLLKGHRVLVVKPIILQKRLVKQQTRGGKILGRRMSPKRGCVIDLFDELIYFTGVFPHQNLGLEVPLVEVEEWRYPGHGRRRRWRRNDHQVEDQKLLKLHRVHRFRTSGDLLQLVPRELPNPFPHRTPRSQDGVFHVGWHNE